jgi:elongation factor 3
MLLTDDINFFVIENIDKLTLTETNPTILEQEMKLLTNYFQDTNKRLLCSMVYQNFVNKLSPINEAHVVNFIPLILIGCGDKNKNTCQVNYTTMMLLGEKISKHAFGLFISMLLNATNTDCKWKTKVVAMNVLEKISVLHPIEVKRYLHTIIPVIHTLLWDMKLEVVESAEKTMLIIFDKLVKNKDLEPFLGVLISAMKNLNEIPECIQTLASTTFVQTVDGASLSVIVPLLLRGFREKKNTVHRQCAVIISNMVKLVVSPMDVEPFLPELLLNLEKSEETMSEPETRDVLKKSHIQLTKLEKTIKELKKIITSDKIVENLISNLDPNNVVSNTTSFQQSINYIATLCESLVHTNSVSNYKTDILPYIECLSDVDNNSIYNIEDFLIKFSNIKTNSNDTDVEKEVKLCDTVFTLAYGSKVLLHNTRLKLLKGHRYGLLGGNDSGKTTLMRAIANDQLDGFPDKDTVRTVFVEADIQGELSHLNNLEYIFEDPRIRVLNIEYDEIRDILKTVGFTDKMLNDNVSTLSGGWRMKLALARAMLQKADVLLLDEPTNHLDVINVAWVQSYINSLSNTTSIIVSHDKTMLDSCCTDILVIENLGLCSYSGNLSNYVKEHPEAMSFFELKSDKLKFTFPQPGPISGIKSRGKPLIKMDNVTFTYPNNDKPTIYNITVRASMASRVACLGVNGAGKSTMIKILTGELVPQIGTVWKHDACRIAYVAQHAFHHIEQHLNKTANEYIRWRYDGNEDKETINKKSLLITKEEEELLAIPVPIDSVDKHGDIVKVKRIFDRLTGSRRPIRKEFEYEVAWKNVSLDYTSWLSSVQLIKMGAEKHIKQVDLKIDAATGSYMRPLTSLNVEKHIEDCGLEKEYATHNRLSALSGGQKVKVVLAAATWMCPHILILDEPTNYLDRDSLAALAGAIKDFEGGVIIISHNNEFVSTVCPETWVLENGYLDVKGDADWMKKQDTEINFESLDTMIDAAGNTIKVKQPKLKMSRQERKNYEKLKKAARARGEDVSSDEE